ncbi:GNAT family N-acetyltransferase [Flavobacteriaceae bacterium SZ-1-7]|uniref:GNAT family N-acetyltransferase n=1 Tax=Tamlana sedimenti TaxID=3134126 RepID=UPI0031229C26
MIEIRQAKTKTDYLLIEHLADAIWREHYISIIGKPQVDYMLGKFQSAMAVENQILDGFEYFLLYFDGTPVGYISIKPEVTALFLSKIYVLSGFRGKNIGKTAMRYVEEKAKDYSLKSIRLTVNKNNSKTIKAYEKLGFIKDGAIVIDIGNGFLMDDFVMVRAVVY